MGRGAARDHVKVSMKQRVSGMVVLEYVCIFGCECSMLQLSLLRVLLYVVLYRRSCEKQDAVKCKCNVYNYNPKLLVILGN